MIVNTMKSYMLEILIALTMTFCPVSASSNERREADTISVDELKSAEHDSINVYNR